MFVQVLPNSRGSPFGVFYSRMRYGCCQVVLFNCSKSRRQRIHMQSHWHHRRGGLIIVKWCWRSSLFTKPPLTLSHWVKGRQGSPGFPYVLIYIAKDSCYRLEGRLGTLRHHLSGLLSHLFIALWRRVGSSLVIAGIGAKGSQFFLWLLAGGEWLLSKSFVSRGCPFPGPLLETAIFSWGFDCSQYGFWVAGFLVTSLGSKRKKTPQETHHMSFFETMVPSWSVLALYFNFLLYF